MALMRKRRLALAAASMMLVAAAPAFCKFFPEPILADDPLLAASGSPFPSGMGSSLEYGDYALRTDYVDDFYFRLGASPVFAASGNSFALGGLFESILMCSIVPSDQDAASIAHFWMNDVQFQYGLYASCALPIAASWRPHLLAEYSRASEHPFVGRDYSQVATDVLRVGLDFPELREGSFGLLCEFAFGYHQLFDGIWQSGLPQSRISWILQPTAEAQYALKADLSLVARLYPEIFVDRFSGSIDADYYAEAGLAFERGEASTEVLFTFYESRDSEILAGEATPAMRAGFAVRFSVDRAEPRPERP
jgi:hypothetical protein